MSTPISTTATPQTHESEGHQPARAGRGSARPTARERSPIAAVPLSRLVRVELRKQVDTLAGRWLMVAVAGVIAVVMTIVLLTQDGLVFSDYLAVTTLPMAVALPVIGIMGATSEWSQRTAMTTFALEPRRGRVVTAKVLSALVFALAAFVLAVALAALGQLIGGLTGDTTDWSISGWLIGGVALLVAIFVLQGTAFGMALLNTPAAIVAYLVLPTVWTILGAFVSWLTDASQWLDLNLTTNPLTSEAALTGGEWARLGTSVAVWVLLPLAIGTWRVLRREVK